MQTSSCPAHFIRRCAPAAFALSLACGRTPLDDIDIHASSNAADASVHSAIADGGASSSPPTGASDGSTSGPPADGCSPATHLSNGGCIPDDPASALPSTAPCSSGGNVLHFEADHDAWIYDGSITITNGTWKAMPLLNGQENQGAWFQAQPPGAASDDAPWLVYATVYPINGTIVVLGKVYAPTTTQSTATAFDVPLLDVQTFNSCEQAEGAFRFDALEDSADSMTLVSATLSFWIHCTGHRGLLHGCVHYAL